MASVTAVGGMSAGQDALKFIWDQIAAIALYYGLPLSVMSEATAANLFTIIVLAVFYWTREPDTATPQAPAARAFDHHPPTSKEKEP